MDIVSQFAKALGNLKTPLQEVEQSGCRSAESIFGRLAHEIFGKNTLKDWLYLSCNLHSPVTSPGSHSEIVDHKPKETDHPDVPSHKMWLKSLGLTVHDHKSLLSKTGWLGSNMICAAQTIMREQFRMTNSFQDTLYSQLV